jgi:hypothetical protein
MRRTGADMLPKLKETPRGGWRSMFPNVDGLQGGLGCAGLKKCRVARHLGQSLSLPAIWALTNILKIG